MPAEAALSGDATVDSKELEAQTAPAQAVPAGPDPESFFKEHTQPEAAAGAADPFSALDQAKAKEDFDSAFASFKAGSGSKGPSDSAEPAPAQTANQFSAFSTEFPPISELERDEESDSEDEQGGFDDDFAPSSPNAKPADKSGSPTLNKTVAAEAPASAAGKGSGEADNIFGNAPPPGSFPEATPLEEPASSVKPPAAQHSLPKQSSAFDDLDDDFADLEDAKEGSQDDDFQTISRSGLDDFNPTFDSPPPASKESVAPPGSSLGNGPIFGSESTFDFASIDHTASQTSTAPPAEGAAKPAENHDWDAIFASLDDAPPATTSASPPPPTSPGSGDAAAVAATAAAAPAPAAAETMSMESPRPDGPGRALTEDGTHDDPILKNLTSMGYSRKDALNALEKYDYNLERVS